MKYRQLFLVFIGLVTFLLLTSCSPWAVVSQVSTDQWMTISPGNSIGQTFVADYSGLNAIYFLLKPQLSGTGTLIMHLRSTPTSSIDLTTVAIAVQQIDSQKYYRFDFPKITQSNSQYYYAYLTIEGEGVSRAGSGAAASYQNGAAYQNNAPIEAQFVLNLEYDRAIVLLGIAQQYMQWMVISLVGLLLFTIPGWTLLRFFWRGWNELSGFEKLPLSIGVSLAFYTLFVLATYLFHIQLGAWYAWLPIGIGVFVLMWGNRHEIGKFISVNKSPHSDPARKVRNNPIFWTDVCLIIILGLIFLVRFWAVRGLDQPMWNDSLHHTTITQLLLDNQGLFSSWLPYAAYKTFSMHFGFPLGAALLAWITGISSGQAVLYFGQVLNIFAPLALYPLAVRLTHGNRMGGVIAVLVAGLLSPMPAYYINWGRYAQLGGQVILPVAMWMLWEVVDNAALDQTAKAQWKFPWVKIVITGGVIAGMILFEFRMIFIITTFVIAMAIGQLISSIGHDMHQWLREIWSIGLVGIVSVILFLPWGLKLEHSNLVNLADFNTKVSTIIDLVTKDYQTWLNIRFYLPIGLIIISLLGLIWAVLNRDWSMVSIGLWVAGMSALYSLTILRIPWVQYVQSFAVLISLYIPAALFTGYVAGDFSKKVINLNFGKTVTITAVILLSIFGAWNQRKIANSSMYGFVTRPDTQAMSWINEQIPPNARILIEGIHENWVTNVIGADAGWWIALLAHRENTIPPQYALANEAPIDPGYSLSVVNLEAKLEATSVASREGISLLCDYGITHVYIGQKQGAVGNPNAPLFTPVELTFSGVFQLIYHQDRVYIYSVENACSQ